MAAAHWTWDDVWTEQLPFDQFIQFVLYSPPTSAVFHKIHQGWTSDTHKITDLIEWVKAQMCINAESPESAREKLGWDWRPGQPIPGSDDEAPHMTVADYMKLAGLTMTES